MKIPNPILQLALNIALKNAGAVLASPLGKIPHIDVIAKAYAANKSLEVILGLYLQATETLSDDEIGGKVGEALEFINNDLPKIIAKFSTLPAKAVLAELLGDLAIPDFNDVDGDEKPVIDIINDIINELAD